MVVAVLQGSEREGRMGDRVARWVISELRKRGHEAVPVDSAELRLPVLDKMWKEVKDDDSPHYAELKGKLKPLADLYARADGFAIVSGEYNHSVPPGLTNLIDHFLEEYFFRPSAIVCYSAGRYGGVRAAMQLRSLLGEVGMPSIPSILPIPSVGRSLREDGHALTDDLAKIAPKFFDEFDWYMSALKAQRQVGLPY